MLISYSSLVLILAQIICFGNKSWQKNLQEEHSLAPCFVSHSMYSESCCVLVLGRLDGYVDMFTQSIILHVSGYKPFVIFMFVFSLCTRVKGSFQG